MHYDIRCASTSILDISDVVKSASQSSLEGFWADLKPLGIAVILALDGLPYAEDIIQVIRDVTHNQYIG